MRLAFTAAKLISVWLLFILVHNTWAFAQSKANGISVSLSVNSTEFTRSRKPRAAVTITNRSGEPIQLKSFEGFGLELQLKERPVTFCRIDECFSASVFRRGGKLASNGSITLIAKLYDLYWHNSISSIMAANYPRNLFTGVPPGTYELYAWVSVKADNWKPDEPRFFRIKSNNVSPVTLSRGK